MDFIKITKNKKEYLPLLLLADEQESMIDKYLDTGDLFVLKENGETLGLVVVALVGKGEYEIKNLAVAQNHQKKGYGKKLIQFVEQTYKDYGHTLIVATGDSPNTVPFYEHCGFKITHKVKNFFVGLYDYPIIEDGIEITDAVWFKKPL